MATCSSWAWQCRVVTNLPVASCDVTSCCSLFRVWRNAHCRRSAAAFTLSSLEARCGWSDCELSGGETCNPRRLPLANRPLLAPTCDGTARTICSPKRPQSEVRSAVGNTCRPATGRSAGQRIGSVQLQARTRRAGDDLTRAIYDKRTQSVYSGAVTHILRAAADLRRLGDLRVLRSQATIECVSRSAIVFARSPSRLNVRHQQQRGTMWAPWGEVCETLVCFTAFVCVKSEYHSILPTLEIF